MDFKLKPGDSKKELENAITLTLPYYGYASETLKKQLMKLFKRENLNIVILFKTYKVSNYFRVKDVTPRKLMSNVVYEFKCPVDQDKSYIGMTTRHLITRVNEHKSRKGSAICQHFKECSCKDNFIGRNCIDNFIGQFKILAKGRGLFDVRIKEALLIKENKPYLNIRSKTRNDYTVRLF